MMKITETENFIHIQEYMVSVNKVRRVILPLIKELDCEIIDTDWGEPKKFFRVLSQCDCNSEIDVDLMCKKRGKSWQSTLK